MNISLDSQGVSAGEVPRLVAFPRPHRPPGPPLKPGPLAPSPLPPSERGAMGGESRPEGGSCLEGGRGPGSWCSSACKGSRGEGKP